MPEKKRNIYFWIFAAVILFIFLSFLGPCTSGVLAPMPYRSLCPFSGKVVDADTKEPIEGAAVLGVYYYASHSIAGSNLHLIDLQETLTDKNGEFEIKTGRRWFAWHRGYPTGRLDIFKPGYGTFPSHKGARAVGENRSWPPPEKYVVYEIRKLKTIKERKENVICHTDPYSEIPFERRKKYIKQINEERKSLGLRLEIIPNKERQK